jgi:hypothetical protein
VRLGRNAFARDKKGNIKGDVSDLPVGMLGDAEQSARCLNSRMSILFLFSSESAFLRKRRMERRFCARLPQIQPDAFHLIISIKKSVTKKQGKERKNRKKKYRSKREPQSVRRTARDNLGCCLRLSPTVAWNPVLIALFIGIRMRE